MSAEIIENVIPPAILRLTVTVRPPSLSQSKLEGRTVSGSRTVDWHHSEPAHVSLISATRHEFSSVARRRKPFKKVGKGRSGHKHPYCSAPRVGVNSRRDSYESSRHSAQRIMLSAGGGRRSCRRAYQERHQGRIRPACGNAPGGSQCGGARF